jgi:peptidoglycan L-alanyl-D-glutamate endopeptidase CwlK
MFEFGKRSIEQLATCHKDLQLIAQEALKTSFIDFGISEGHRSLEKQLQYFREGKSKVDGIRTKGKHNYNPSLAFDMYAYIPGKPEMAYDVPYLTYLVIHIIETANKLKKEGLITHEVRSGADWDKDKIYLSDQSFDDLPHIELV